MIPAVEKSDSSILYTFLFRILCATIEAFDSPVRTSFFVLLADFADNFIIYSVMSLFFHVVYPSW